MPGVPAVPARCGLVVCSELENPGISRAFNTAMESTYLVDVPRFSLIWMKCCRAIRMRHLAISESRIKPALQRGRAEALIPLPAFASHAPNRYDAETPRELRPKPLIVWHWEKLARLSARRGINPIWLAQRFPTARRWPPWVASLFLRRRLPLETGRISTSLHLLGESPSRVNGASGRNSLRRSTAGRTRGCHGAGAKPGAQPTRRFCIG